MGTRMPNPLQRNVLSGLYRVRNTQPAAKDSRSNGEKALWSKACWPHKPGRHRHRGARKTGENQKHLKRAHSLRANRGRPRKGQILPPKPPKRVELQATRSLEENLKDLPTHCNVGTKKNSKGYKETWIGYKLHLDCIDGDIPISAILSSASLHDSQVAIPLAQMSSQRVTNLYDLMDAAYDSPAIHSFSKSLGHMPIIDKTPGAGRRS